MVDRKYAIRNKTRAAANNKDACERCKQCKHERRMRPTGGQSAAIEIEIANGIVSVSVGFCMWFVVSVEAMLNGVDSNVPQILFRNFYIDHRHRITIVS